MKYLNNFLKYIAFQIVFGLIGMSHSFCEPMHISGAVHGHAQPTVAHISGRAFARDNSLTIKTHVSGTKKVLPVQKSMPIESEIIRKARRMGITVGDNEKSIPTQRRGTTQKKSK